MPTLTPNNTRGFTLIELVVVIIILGILAVIVSPKFISLEQDAQISSVKGVGGAFKSAVDMAHSAWIAKGAVGPLEDVPIYSDNPDRSGTIDINANGWPAQHYLGPVETNPVLNNVADCLSVWKILFAGASPTMSPSGDSSETDYKASYTAPGQCRYSLARDNNYYIDYNSNDGSVVTTTPE
ncbi:prepilin-type N-terminal cleavage/methylation domain-containing protein [Shewanella sp. NIFS-20-20]|uniref:prepilin-type N-terminal cleavage/methylation domain-containing protein n=1 Tax=Shewanella sp. NIFS-20-20 TaxID=2853806 RepID=UPI00210EC3EE|nr:prepilin-type N-terminal cleavage/methylation domain-containing protein [Shewanella sp. NIFS-20-20]